MIKTLVTGATLVLLVAAGSAQAAPQAAMAGSPKQPIPYAKLNAYMAASPKARARTDWWAGSDMASTGMSTDTAASLPATTMAPPNAAMNGAISGAASSSVDNASGASQFSGATMTTTTSGATSAQTQPH